MYRFKAPAALLAVAILAMACSEGPTASADLQPDVLVNTSHDLEFVCGPEGQGGNWDEKIEPFDQGTIERDDPIIAICIKAGSTVEVLFTEDGSYSPEPGCTYEVEGLGTTTVTVTKTGSGSGCPGISHVELWFGEVPALEDLVVTKDAAGSYDRTVTWELEKTVDPESHSGAPGDIFNSDWTVEVTKTEELDNYKVVGKITIYNPNAIAVDFSIDDVLDDGTVAEVTCPVSGDNTGTVPAAAGGVNGEIECDYEAFPTDDSATKNTATVTPGHEEIGANIAEATVSFDENLIGDDDVLLEDDEGPLNESLSDSDSFTYEGTFECPTDLTLYIDGIYQFDVVNVATLTGDNTDLDDDATVTVVCALVWEGETATASYAQWPDTRNWFHYADDEEQDIVTGRDLVKIGTLTFGVGEMCFALDEGVRMDESKAGNVKIHPMDEEPEAYIPPGSFSHHFDGAGSDFCVTIDYKAFNGVHLDVEILQLP
jgi:hypothetical protein